MTHMKRNSFSNIANEFKDILLNDLLNRFSNLDRDSLFEKNTLIWQVSEQITAFFLQLLPSKMPTSSNKAAFIKELATSADERYADCLTSVHASEKYLEWLFHDPFCGISDQERDAHWEVVSKRANWGYSHVMDLNHLRKCFVRLFSGEDELKPGLVPAMMKSYLALVLKLMKCQQAVYEKEAELGNQFSKNTIRIIKLFATEAGTTRSEKAAHYLTQVERMLRGHVPTVKTKSAADSKSLLDGLSSLEKELQKKRDYLEKIHRMIQLLEEMLVKAEMEEDIQTAAPMPKQRMAIQAR